MIGIDYSMAHLGVLSNDEFLEYSKYLLKNMEKIKKLNRSFSRCIKDSNNFKKRKRELANLYTKIRNQKNDWLYKTARKIPLEYDVIFIEDIEEKYSVVGPESLLVCNTCYYLRGKPPLLLSGVSRSPDSK